MKRLGKCIAVVIIMFVGIICGVTAIIATAIIVTAIGLIGELLIYFADFIIMLKEPTIYE